MRNALWKTLGITSFAIVGGGIAWLAWPDTARVAIDDVTGANPKLTAPREQSIPTMGVATAVGWAKDAAPTPAPGLAVRRFAEGLAHPRWLYRLPNGDILVAETGSPPIEVSSIADRVMVALMEKGGALVPSANRITLLRDGDGDGVAETRTTFLSGLNSPFGMTLLGDALYVADTDRLLRFHYRPGQAQIADKGEVIVTYPSEGHWARNVIASADGARLYVSVGSNSDHGEDGPSGDPRRAAILEIDPARKTWSVLGAGIRNPNGMAIEPNTGKLWTVVNERDMLGSDLVPDYLTSVSAGDHFGWPWYYWGDHVDTRAGPANPGLQGRVRKPDYALGPHVAALGLSFAADARLGSVYGNGAFIALHGSWNRKPRSGYKLVFVPFGNDGRPATGASMTDMLTGFLSPAGEAQGRPVGVITDRNGALLVADDVGNIIWRVTATAPNRPRSTRRANLR